MPDEVAAATGITLPEHEDYDTVAGLFLQKRGRIPKPGDEVVVHWAAEHTFGLLLGLAKHIVTTASAAGGATTASATRT